METTNHHITQSFVAKLRGSETNNADLRAQNLS